MTVSAKICGITDIASMESAVLHGAAFVGLVFYSPSPRYVELELARRLFSIVPENVKKVGLFVDPDDNLLAQTLAHVPVDLLQLHGDESPERCSEIRRNHDVSIMKAIKVANTYDIEKASTYNDSIDWLMFDAKAPKSLKNALPGGNNVSFDWSLLAGRSLSVPWMLAGGLNTENVSNAVKQSGAIAVDVSSGVEFTQNKKNPLEIERFLKVVSKL
ncbi:MAG: N-(5'-phosphoribosyl)anthranilate isomerase [Alphaproteobacteria bacterium MarineAlpha12_Bin1]|jgi:phosphoribosylanthranilate isomerase|nr:MAG: N-(5'-phosphoribosyl)anthranilate isomerase [Alphaproteobacteria bacterium MarineAlpha12_Bin1]|tara:strand:+ start:313 stop:960 length:648 start_codon:yes stop_codon:yes gene_type:complete